MTRIEELTAVYRLKAHPEGGAFAEVYTAPFFTPEGRPLSGSIYYLLVGAELSRLHVIDCDELWYHHEGCGMRLTLIDPEGRVTHADLGPDASAGQRLMVVIPRGVIFGAENLDPGGYSFASCMTTPRYAGETLVGREHLRRLCPDRFAELARLAYPGEDREA